MSDREQDSDADDGSDDVFTTGNKRPAPVDQLKRRRRRSYGRMAAAGEAIQYRIIGKADTHSVEY